MSPRLVILLLLCVGCASVAAADQPFDGSKKMICAIVETHECASGSNCEPGNADDVRLPRLFRLDLKKNRIDMLDEGRRDEETQIIHVEKTSRAIVLQGIEGDRAWSVSVHTDTGSMVVSIADLDEAVTAFGACAIE